LKGLLLGIFQFFAPRPNLPFSCSIFLFCLKFKWKRFQPAHIRSEFLFISSVGILGIFFVGFSSSCLLSPCSFPLADHLYGFIMILIIYAELLFLLVASLCVVDCVLVIHTSGISRFYLEKKKPNDRFFFLGGLWTMFHSLISLFF